MSTPAYADAAGRGTAILADTETLAQVAATWRALLDTHLAVPQEIPAYYDPASSAVAAATADWRAIQKARIARRDTAADELMAWVGTTSGAFTFTDHNSANAISSVGTSSNATMLI